MRSALLMVFMSLTSSAMGAAGADPAPNSIPEPSSKIQRETYKSPAPRPTLSGPEIRALQYKESDRADEEDTRTLREDN